MRTFLGAQLSNFPLPVPSQSGSKVQEIVHFFPGCCAIKQPRYTIKRTCRLAELSIGPGDAESKSHPWRTINSKEICWSLKRVDCQSGSKDILDTIKDKEKLVSREVLLLLGGKTLWKSLYIQENQLFAKANWQTLQQILRLSCTVKRIF